MRTTGLTWEEARNIIKVGIYKFAVYETSINFQWFVCDSNIHRFSNISGRTCVLPPQGKCKLFTVTNRSIDNSNTSRYNWDVGTF